MREAPPSPCFPDAGQVARALYQHMQPRIGSTSVVARSHTGEAVAGGASQDKRSDVVKVKHQGRKRNGRSQGLDYDIQTLLNQYPSSNALGTRGVRGSASLVRSQKVAWAAPCPPGVRRYGFRVMRAQRKTQYLTG